ncbi:MAG: hypothetical protein QG608_2026 [Actinomycetota bacterium]|nr:hypothetical protein [Actinomycetota bacterium]
MALVGSEGMDEEAHPPPCIPAGETVPEGGTAPDRGVAPEKGTAPEKGIVPEGTCTSEGEGEAWTVLARLLSGPALYGGLGWFLDGLLGTGFLFPVGIVGGMALAVYVIAVRYRTR